MQVAKVMYKLERAPEGGAHLTFFQNDASQAHLVGPLILTDAQAGDLAANLMMLQLDAMADAPSGADFAMPAIGGIHL